MSFRIGADGRFCGYAAIFGLPDDGGDVVAPGAFGASLKRRGAGRVRMLFQHDPKEPVGRWTRLIEDSEGLWAEGELTAGVPRADALRALIGAGAINGLSIGFRTVRADRLARGKLRRLDEIDLWEISIVTFPMQDRARIGGADRARDALDAVLGAFR
jgi:HK97 family phage prohead protease